MYNTFTLKFMMEIKVIRVDNHLYLNLNEDISVITFFHIQVTSISYLYYRKHDSLNYAYNLVWSVTIRLLIIVIHCIYKTFLIATDTHKKNLSDQI
jgi:hypothetical protein